MVLHQSEEVAMCTFIKKKDGKIFLTHLTILLVTSNIAV